MSLALYAGGLRARFDRLALRPPAAAADEAWQAARHPAAWEALRAWCWRGAGPGNSAWSRPGTRPAVDLRLAIAALQAPGDARENARDDARTDARDDASMIAWADALARQLDGSRRLAALPGAAAGLRLRLGVKAHEAMWWRARRADDPWDTGWALTTPPALRQWRSGFMPRRATLILADGREAALLQQVLAGLAARSDDFRHPVRWLWLAESTGVTLPQSLAVARFKLQ